jgi:outer membrane receptor protein involved in Fe transport
MNSSTFRILFLLGGALTGAVLAPVPARAAQAGQDDGAGLADLPLEQLMQVQTVTSASRFAQAPADAPSSVSVLTSQDIREYGWRTLADALAALPGLYVSSDRNYAYLGARGFLRPGDYDSRFLLLIDGMRTNDNVYDQASIGTEGLIDIDLVERIEYVPGPGAAVYGSNALFGVINVITKSGSALAGLHAAQSFGSLGERRTRLSYGAHAQDGSDLVLSATSYTRRGGDLYSPEFDGADGSDGVAHGLDWDRAHKLYAKVHRGDLTFSAGYVARTKGVPTASFGAVFGAPDSTRDTQAFVNLAYDAVIGPDLRAGATLYWGRADYLGVGLYPDDSGAHLNVDGDHGAWYGANAHVTYAGLHGHRILAGVELQRNRRRDQFSFDPGPGITWLDDRRSDSRRAAFVEDEWRLGSKTILNAGLRYDRYGTVGNRLSPRVALIRTLTPQDTVKAIYGTAFRTPNSYEQYYAIDTIGGQEANPALRPESIRTEELVWERRPDAYGKLSLSVYRYQVRNLITQGENPVTGLLRFTNTERATAHGAELAGERTFDGGLRVRASYSRQHAIDSAGHALVNSPRQLAKAGASLPWAPLRARIAAEWQCASRRLTEHAETGGYCSANLVLSSASSVKGWDWSLGVYNALDRSYADPAGPAFLQEAIVREGRTAVGKLEYGF